LPPLNELVALEFLDVRNCAQLEELPPLDHLTALRCLMLKGCKKLSTGCLKLTSHHGHRVVVEGVSKERLRDLEGEHVE
jgi:hypothetical protein